MVQERGRQALTQPCNVSPRRTRSTRSSPPPSIASATSISPSPTPASSRPTPIAFQDDRAAVGSNDRREPQGRVLHATGGGQSDDRAGQGRTPDRDCQCHGRVGRRTDPAYCASKGGVKQLVKCSPGLRTLRHHLQCHRPRLHRNRHDQRSCPQSGAGLSLLRRPHPVGCIGPPRIRRPRRVSRERRRQLRHRHHHLPGWRHHRRYVQRRARAARPCRAESEDRNFNAEARRNAKSATGLQRPLRASASSR